MKKSKFLITTLVASALALSGCSLIPSVSPGGLPTRPKTSTPTSVPTSDPTSDPTSNPTSDPTSSSTPAPTSTGTSTSDPTSTSTSDPTSVPTSGSDPSSDPTSSSQPAPVPMDEGVHTLTYNFSTDFNDYKDSFPYVDAETGVDTEHSLGDLPIVSNGCFVGSYNNVGYVMMKNKDRSTVAFIGNNFDLGAITKIEFTAGASASTAQKYDISFGHTAFEVAQSSGTEVAHPGGAVTKSVEEGYGFFAISTKDSSKNGQLGSLTIEYTIVGGGGGGGTSTSGSTSAPTSGTSEVPPASDWSDADKALMQEHLGVVVPPLSGTWNAWAYYESGNFVYSSSSDAQVSVAGDELVAAGWTYEGVDDYGDPLYSYPVGTEGDSVLANVYVAQSGATYITVKFVPAPHLTEDTEWNADAKEIMMAVFVEELPFMKFGYQYVFEGSGFMFDMVDYHNEDLTEAYKELLKSQGWEEGVYTEEDPDTGEVYEYQDLYKELDNGASLIVILMYNSSYGNVVYGIYQPLVTPSAEWPASVVAEFTGEYEVPAYSPVEGAYQYYYDQQGALHIEALISEDSVDAFAESVAAAGFVVSAFDDETDEDSGYVYHGYSAVDWEETVELQFVSVSLPKEELPAVDTTISSSWPEADKALMTEYVRTEIQDLPGTWGAWAYDDEYACLYASSADADAEAVEATFEQAGWEYAGVDDYGDPLYAYYVGEEGAYALANIYTTSAGAVEIDVYFSNAVEPVEFIFYASATEPESDFVAEFPASDIAEFLAPYEVASEVPAFSNNTGKELKYFVQSFEEIVAYYESIHAQLVELYGADLADSAFSYFYGFDYSLRNQVAAEQAGYFVGFYDPEGALVSQFASVLAEAGYEVSQDEETGVVTAVAADLTIVVAHDSDGGTYIQVCEPVEVPSQEDWTDADKAVMTQYLGTVVPFFGTGNWTAWSYYAGDGSVYADSYDADPAVIVAALEALGFHASTIEEELDEYTVSYMYDFGEDEYLLVHVSDYTVVEGYPVEVSIWSVGGETPAADWSDADKALMQEHLGIALPYFGGTWAAWAYDSNQGVIYSYSANVSLETLSGVLTGAGLTALGEQDGISYFSAQISQAGDTLYVGAYEEQGNTFVMAYVEPAEVPPVSEPVSLSFADLSLVTMDAVNNYTSICHVAYADHNWTIFGGNNNSNNATWTFIKFGQKGNANVDFIQTEFVASGTSITINFRGNDKNNGGDDRIKLENITSIKVYVSDEAFGEAVCTDESKLVATVSGDDLPSTTATAQDFVISIPEGFSGYVQIVIEIAADGTNNGSVHVISVTIA